MKGVHVGRAPRIAVAQGGTLWGEYDRETQLYGLATPGGRVTTTGVGGFTLGGGYGWLSPVHGLTCDNLVAADVVTADGRFLHVSEKEHPELLWGLRGAGANFGVVTAYELLVHPVGPELHGRDDRRTQRRERRRHRPGLPRHRRGRGRPAGTGAGHHPRSPGAVRPARDGRQTGPRRHHLLGRRPGRRCRGDPAAARADGGRHRPGAADALHRLPVDDRRVRPEALAELPPRPAPERRSPTTSSSPT